jgi:FkbO/Hyg5 family chorismatase
MPNPAGNSLKFDIETKIMSQSAFETSDILNSANILGIIEFTDANSSLSNRINKEIPFLTVQLKPFSTESYIELWLSKGNISYGQTNNFSYATDGENLFGTCSFKENDRDLDILSKNIYNNIINDIKELNNPYLYRIWNYLPDINNYNNGIERYKLFCKGRTESFEENCIKEFPASTCVGSKTGDISLYFLSSSNPDYIHIENSRQIPAYKYPEGQPSSFARATYYKRNNNKFNIYISGTASIIGSESVHTNNAEQQCLTTLKNIELLLSEQNLRKYAISDNLSLNNLDCIKVYIRNDSDFAMIKDICEKSFSPTSSIAYLKANICRPELLVEIEGLIQK